MVKRRVSLTRSVETYRFFFLLLYTKFSSLVANIDELLALNEKLIRARATYDKMMEQSIAKYSNPAYAQYQPQYQTTPGYGQNGQQYTNASFQSPPSQQQYSQAPVAGQQLQYAPYQPQTQGQPQAQLTFDQAYAPQAPIQGQVPQDYNQVPLQQAQGLAPAQGNMQGYAQQPNPVSQGYVSQQVGDNQAQYSQPSSGYAPQPQYAPTGVFQ